MFISGMCLLIITVCVDNCDCMENRQLLKVCDRVSPQVYNGRITSVEDFMLEVAHFCRLLLVIGV